MFRVPLKIIRPQKKHLSTLIFLHGYQGAATSIFKSAKKLSSNLEHLRIVLPTAPFQDATPGFATGRVRSWFYSEKFPFGKSKDIDQMSKKLSSLIFKEQQILLDNGSNEKNLVFGGFSQGGFITIYTALTNLQKQIAGTFGIGSIVPTQEQLEGKLTLPLKMNSMSHLSIMTKDDPIINYAWNEPSIKYLKSVGVPFENKLLNKGGHKITSEAIEILTQWMKKLFTK
ncbi:acyl protein thioesterase family [Anaeramoeba flamelloides]|uniref:Acyl protein thioesterase family n=1 Tax=Anaeramoeba flamelloides TaxID=1746091 RepID=A0AAV7YED9_9EUKA|nr:acyl protein thioesterase family [Anaeramoeba flamelloides]